MTVIIETSALEFPCTDCGADPYVACGDDDGYSGYEEVSPHQARLLDGAVAERDRLSREMESLQEHHARVVAQRNKDWDALMVEIALAVGDNDEREAAHLDETEEFDPWSALRKFAASRVVRCRIYDAACINHAYCDERGACCAGDADCTPLTTKATTP